MQCEPGSKVKTPDSNQVRPQGQLRVQASRPNPLHQLPCLMGKVHKLILPASTHDVRDHLPEHVRTWLGEDPVLRDACSRRNTTAGPVTCAARDV